MTAIGVLEGCRGSGKTTALREWISTIPDSVFVEDAGAPGAWEFFLAAIESDPTVRVGAIDQFERAPEGAAETVLSLVERYPELRVIVAGRSVGALGNRLVRVRHDIVRLGPSDLAFDDDEVKEMLGVRPAPAELDILRLPLVCIAAAALVEEEGMSLAPAARAAASSVLAEALEGIDPLVVSAIQHMAVPERIPEGSPLPGFSPSDHRALLAELARLGLGVLADGEFAFAPSWRAVLSEEFRNASPLPFRFAHASVAAELVDAEHAVDALGHWIDAAQPDRAALTAREYWREIVALKPAQTVSLLERADRAIFGRSATLCALMAECATELGDHRRGETWWRAALTTLPGAEGVRAFRAVAGGAAERSWDVFLRARALRGLGMYELAAVAADEGMSILGPERLLPPRTSVVGGMMAEFALAFLYVGQLDRARALLSDASALAPRGSSGWFTGRAIGVAVEALCGNRIGAERILDEVDRLLIEPRLARSTVGSWVALGRAVLGADRGRADQARRSVTDARERVTRDLATLIDFVESIIELTHGQPELALAMVTAVSQDDKAAPFLRDWVDWVRVACLVRLGRARSADSVDLSGSSLSPRMITAGEHMLSGDLASAFVLLAPVLTQRSPDMTERFLAAAHGMLVIAALGIGDTATAQAALRRLSSLNDTSGTTLPVAFITRSSIELVSRELPGAERVFSAMVPPGTTPALELRERPVLSAAQRRVLGVLAEESSLSAIAERLSLSRNTVKTHLRSVYRALGADGRETALIKATKAGLMDWTRGTNGHAV
ncbi:DNA-binding CsgD family transcriptional regulator [Leifsonia sp. AK011]|uniref:LuxR C-terminal-related transcriptional regulator n=1 Tax=Leifsonia sp. AK011 TaxID=2723075 RepID=UPI0015CB481D|nr:LuxR family transcriptional regulator [Leifsonia sp. AK011]NYF08986.1 DNA-binding CsgD family transcriptional regulator [Leifsonia sp. AK011]